MSRSVTINDSNDLLQGCEEVTRVPSGTRDFMTAGLRSVSYTDILGYSSTQRTAFVPTRRNQLAFYLL